jgi:hypothetical protein
LIIASDSPFEIRAPGWQASFQRHVLDANDTVHSPNRGALPCFLIGKKHRDRLIAVPLANAESLWIAVTCGRYDAVRGRTMGGDPLSISLVSTLSPRSVLLSVDAVRRRGRSCPIDHRVVAVARSARRRPSVSLIVTISACHRTEILRIALVTPRLYTRLSGRPSPRASLPEHAYAGWLLP